MNATLEESEIVGEWHTREPVTFMCPGGPLPDDECDCGFVGRWDYRHVHTWLERPGMKRNDEIIRRDMALGWPHRPNDEGYWCIAGYDERCPGCGDMERFDMDAERIAVHVSTDGRRRRAEILRQKASEIEGGSSWQADDPADAALAHPLPIESFPRLRAVDVGRPQ